MTIGMGTRRWAWIGRVPPRVADGVVVAVLLVLGLLNLPEALAATAGGPPVAALLVALQVLQAVPLWWRRRWPVAVLAAVLAGAVIRIAVLHVGPSVSALGLLLAVYSVAVYGKPVRRVVVGALGLAVALVGFAEYLWVGSSAAFAVPGPVLLAAWLAGDYVRARRAELADRAGRARREREDESRRAADEERARIARELHDVVAHHLSAIAIQAAGARAVRHTDPPASDRALAEVEASSRRAAGELNRLLGVIRRDDAADGPAGGWPRAPQAGLAGADALLARARDAGLDVHLEVLGVPRPLPEALDLSAYRILQEAVTNAMKHARPARVEVRVRYGERDLEVRVEDDGRGAAAGGPDGGPADGHGLIGMRERVALFGGELSAGPRDGGGFAVRACLPLDGGP
jgi:signal transduction histidine kinase